MSTTAPEIDRQVYDEELREFLPERVFDAHVHLLDRSCLMPGYEFPPRNCFSKFGGAFTVEQYLEWTSAMMPDQEVCLNSFGNVTVSF